MYKQNKKNKNRSYAKVVLSLLAALVILVCCWFAFNKLHNQSAINNTENASTKNEEYSSPTEEEKIAGDQQKEINQQKEKQQTTQSNSSNTVSVIITDAGQYGDVVEVRSFIPDHYEDGTCTITITNSNYKVTKSTPAYRDVSTTICTNPLFDRSDFAVGGDWQVIVSYSSAGSQGTSQAKTIKIE